MNAGSGATHDAVRAAAWSNLGTQDVQKGGVKFLLIEILPYYAHYTIECTRNYR